jgi:nucleoside-diphosphate-sugar epimerase
MGRVLVTGGTGGLGRELVGRLAAAGYAVRVMSRRSRPASLAAEIEWAQADLASGDGLRAAVDGVDTIRAAIACLIERRCVALQQQMNLQRLALSDVNSALDHFFTNFDQEPIRLLATLREVSHASAHPV